MKRRRGGPRRAAGQRGATLVEFSFLLPILTLFLFGIIQFGVAYDKQQSINAAAREGARLAALPTSSLDEIAARAVAASDMSAVGNDPTVVVSEADGTIVGARCPGGTFSRTGNCAVPSAVAEADETVMPCGKEIPEDYVVVTVSTPYDLSFPFFDFGALTIDAEAQFRCE